MVLGTRVAALNAPGYILPGTSDVVYTAPSGTTLNAGTTYYLVVAGNSQHLRLRVTAATALDGVPASGWSMPRARSEYKLADPNAFLNDASRLMFRLRGTLALPSVPRNLRADAGDGRVLLTWDPPASPGTSPVTGYEYRHTTASTFTSTDTWSSVGDTLFDTDTTAGNERRVLVTGLTNDTSYRFELRAVSTVDASAAATLPRPGHVTPRAIACPAPSTGDRRVFWTGLVTMPDATLSSYYGYTSEGWNGTLDVKRFRIGGDSYLVDTVGVDVAAGAEFNIYLEGPAVPDAALILHVCDVDFAMDDDSAFDIAVDNIVNYKWPSTNLDWSIAATRTLRLSLPPDRPATGTPTITGTADVGEVLSADTSAIADPDGIPDDVEYAWQWLRVDADGESNEEVIPTATASTYTLTADDVGKKVKVRVTFADALYAASYTVGARTVENVPREMRTSAAFPAIGTVPPDDADIAIDASAAKATGKVDWVHFDLTRGGDAAAELVVPLTLAPPAGNDWGIPSASLAHEVTFAAGAASARLSLHLAADGIGFSAAATTGGTLTARLGTVAGYDTSDTAAVEVVVVDGPAWTVGLAASAYTFAEDGTGGHIVMQATAAAAAMGAPSLDANGASVLAVGLATVDGTATRGVDYAALPEAVRFAPSGCAPAGGVQVCRASVAFTPVDDALGEPDETLLVVVRPHAGTAPVSIRGPQGAVGTMYQAYPAVIRDDDFGVEAVTVDSAPAAGDTYRLGERIAVAVRFARAVTVTGTPEFVLDIGGAPRTAGYVTGTDTDTLVFAYTVADGDTDGDGIGWGEDALDGATLTEMGTQRPPALAVPAQPPLGAHRVDGAVRVRAVEVRSAPVTGDTYGQGERIEIGVAFTHAIQVTGTPRFAFDLGATPRTASYASGTGTDTLVFAYTVVATDADADGIAWGRNALSTDRAGLLAPRAGVAPRLAHGAQAPLSAHKVDGGGAVTPARVPAHCAAPVFTGGAIGFWDATVEVAALGGGAFGFDADTGAGALDDVDFTRGGATWRIVAVRAGTGAFDLDLDRRLLPAEVARLVVHVCGVALAVRDAVHSEESAAAVHRYRWSGTGIDWSRSVRRTLHLGHDGRAPGFDAAWLDATTLTLQLDEALDTGAVPAASAFTVKVSDTAVSLASTTPVALAGRRVTLTLAAAPAAGAAVTVAYTRPATGMRLRDVALNETATFPDKSVARMALPPAAPRNLRAELGDGRLRLRWDASLDVGLSAVTGYEYRYTSGPYFPLAWTALTARHVRVAGLDNDTRYRFQVRAVNAFGAGTPATLDATPRAMTCAAPLTGDRRAIWTGVVTVEGSDVGSSRAPAGVHGYDVVIPYGRLNTDTFAIGGDSYRVRAVTVTKGLLFFWLRQAVEAAGIPASQREALVLHACDADFALSRSTAEIEFTATPAYEWPNTSLDWSLAATRTVRLSLPANNAATGAPTVTGTGEVGAMLSATTTTIADLDGKTRADAGDAGFAYTWQWLRVGADGVSNERVIPGATASTYTLTTADAGAKVRARVTFTDDLGGVETRTSDAYPSTTTVSRPAATASDATLSALSLGTGTLTPAFAPATLAYTASVPSTVSRVAVTATPYRAGAAVAFLDALGAARTDADTSSTDTFEVDLAAGVNVIQVKVTSQDTTATRTYAVTVTRAAMNTAPRSAFGRVETDEDVAYAFQSSDFAFADADGDALASVTVVTLPAAGALALDGAAVTAGATVTAAELAAGALVFTPAANESGRPYARFRFRVSDGTSESAAWPMRIDVRAVDDVPGPPRLVRTIAGDAKVTMFWDPPVDDGGTPVLRYEYRYRAGTDAFPETWTPVGVDASVLMVNQDTGGFYDAHGVQVLGLMNGVSYTVALRAVNARGGGEAVTTIGAPVENNPLLNTFVINGLPRVGSLLFANLGLGHDGDGAYLVRNEKDFRWFRVDGDIETEIAGETSHLYDVTAADIGKRLKATTSFLDGRGNREEFTTPLFPSQGAILGPETCAAPVFTGYATEVWDGTGDVEISGGAFGFFGTGMDDPDFVIGGTTYTIRIVEAGRVAPGNFDLHLDRALAAGEAEKLVLHVCGVALRFVDARFLTDRFGILYRWTGTGIDWSTHARRTLHLSRDARPPALDAAWLDGTALTLLFDEALDTGAVPAGSAFTVKAGGTAVSLASTTPVALAGRRATLTLAAAPCGGCCGDGHLLPPLHGRPAARPRPQRGGELPGQDGEPDGRSALDAAQPPGHLG